MLVRGLDELGQIEGVFFDASQASWDYQRTGIIFLSHVETIDSINIGPQEQAKREMLI